MRTSIDINSQLLLYAKHQAVQQGCTLKKVREDALYCVIFLLVNRCQHTWLLEVGVSDLIGYLSVKNIDN